MSRYSATLYSLFSVFSILVPLLLRAVSVFRYPVGALSYIFYALVVLGLVLLAVDTFRKKYTPAFQGPYGKGLGVFSALMSVALLAEFVTAVVRVYEAASESGWRLYTVLDTLEALAAFFAMLYFAFVSLTFRGRRYDFQSLFLLHLSPVLWAVLKTLGIMEQSSDVKGDVNSILGQLVLVMMLCFFYCFAQEVYRKKGAMAGTVFFARALAYCAMLFVFDELILLLAREDKPLSEGFLLAVTAAVLCGFSYLFEKNIYLESE